MLCTVPILALLQVAIAPKAAPARGTPFQHAIVISVDGLRSDALIALDEENLPSFARLCRGTSTLNARTDPDWTITLPNHTAMITGRFVDGAEGHAWVENGEPLPGATLAANKQSYVAGMFDVAHDRGFATGMFAGKSKFALYDATWNSANGAPDVTGADDGRDKIDEYLFAEDPAETTSAVLSALARDEKKRKLLFVHYAAVDIGGHTYGWDLTAGSRYMKAVGIVDAELGRILDAIEGSDGLRQKTAIILTADHGGGAPFKSHERATMWVNYIIPLLVWTGASDGPHDLYALNAATRADPGITQPAYDFAGKPPIRNGDAGNLALSLLGLPAVPGSVIGAKQDLVIAAPAR